MTKKVDFAPFVREASEKYRVPEWVIFAMIEQESSGHPDAKSPCGAQGLMQLMPDTAEAMQVRDPFDPRQNIMGGVRYMRSLLRMFQFNMRLALAAYNAGPGHVRHYNGIPPFEETQNYVKKIMAKEPKDDNTLNKEKVV